MTPEEFDNMVDGLRTVDQLKKGEYMQINEPSRPTQKRGGSWLFNTVNSSFRVGVSSIPIGILAILLAAIAGFFGGICYKVFNFFFSIFGA